MNTKKGKPRKAILKRGVDAVKLVEELEKLLDEGHVMLNQPSIDEKEYDLWYESVLFYLKMSFTKPDNDLVSRFVGPPLPLITYGGGVSVQPDLQFELNSDLGDELASLGSIISDIRDQFCN